MSQSFLPYGRQTVTEADIAAVVSVLRSPLLTQGPAVPAFEDAVAEKVGVRHAVAVNSATSALHLACHSLGLSRGDYLWTSPITFVASANCARYCGADVDFVDIEAETGLMNVSNLACKLQEAKIKGTLPKVVIPVHLAGTSCDMKAIADLAKLYNFHIIEDASHAIGGIYRGEPIGNCRYSDICVFSFHPVKIITTGEGGIATTNNQYLARRMQQLRSHGITKDIGEFKFPAAGPWSYEQQILGFNYRMTEFQAALGYSQLQRLEAIVEERNCLLEYYRLLLTDLPVHLLGVPTKIYSSAHLAVICLRRHNVQVHRYVFERLQLAGIGVQLHYAPVHLQPYYRQLGFQQGDFPEAECYSTNAISLPLFPGLGNQAQQCVVNTLTNILTVADTG